MQKTDRRKSKGGTVDNSCEIGVISWLNISLFESQSQCCPPIASQVLCEHEELEMAHLRLNSRCNPFKCLRSCSCSDPNCCCFTLCKVFSLLFACLYGSNIKNQQCISCNIYIWLFEANVIIEVNMREKCKNNIQAER